MVLLRRAPSSRYKVRLRRHRGGKELKLFDLHCDTLYECYETNKCLTKNDLAIDREKTSRYRQYIQAFALFCGAREIGYPQVTNGRRCLLDLPAEQRLDAMLHTAQKTFSENAEWIVLCRTHSDLDEAMEQGKAAALLTIEGADLLCYPESVQKAYDAGVRIVTITWNYDNAYGTPAKISQTQGLKPAGKALIRQLNQYKIVPDVSHLSEAGFWDVAETSVHPFIASHSNSRKICDHFRNLTDEQFATILQADGLVGVNLYSDFVKKGGTCTPDDVVRHIEHFCECGGEKHIALGADMDGCDTLPEGIHTVADMPLLAEALLQKNYKEETVNDIFYENAFRFWHRNF